ncbi:MAG: hypothetical protein Q8Q09_13340 [Deltaproteobacteria bacterium]|nr:hypothetical protein [Deltaproteobacteria bacterium]
MGSHLLIKGPPLSTLRALHVLGVVGFASVAHGCLARATGVEVVVGTNAPVDRLEARVFVRVPGTPWMQSTARMFRMPLDRTSGSAGSFAVIPAAGSARDGAVEVRVEALGVTDQGVSIALSGVRRFRFAPHQQQVIRMYLPVECAAPSRECTTVSAAECTLSLRCEERGLTCEAGGVCVTPEVPLEERSEAGVGFLADASMDAPDVLLREAGDDVPEVDGSVPEDAPGCPAGTSLCGGNCVDLARNMAHCGGCGQSCAGLSNVSAAVCNAGACQVVACSGNFANCDGAAFNGCERLIGQDFGQCSCTLRCASGMECTNGRRSCCDLRRSCDSGADCSGAYRCITISGASAKHCCVP